MNPETDKSKFYLPSYLFDQKLSKEFCKCNYCNFCHNEPEIFENDYNYRMFCYNFAKNVEIVYNKNKENPQLKEKHCKDLESWVYKNIQGNCISSFKTNFDDIDKLNTVLNRINSDNLNQRKAHICDKELKKKFYNNELAKIKTIDDYGENYDFIKNKSDMNDSECYAFYNYLTKNSDLHKEIVDSCSKRVDGKYCPSYYRDKEYDPNELLGTLKCTEKIELSQKESMTDQRDYEACKQELLECSMFNNNKPFGITDFGFFLLIVFSIWGIFLTLLFLYSRIRNGNWSFNRLKKKQILKDTLLGNYEDEMQEDNFKNSDEDLSNIPLHITYQNS
ncbi:PIR Superfamily Protein [Plasmodium ovale wallikeri]|uniref:PIR Superfamily Protein n=2 Tax=Plasmodium ovale TaxID=36330 RepID=A0A1A9ALX1_PLAOA|nr:PIR Superfamily Protein [Plasmodium ovale wallikeri]SBT57075.1 PIR Superfamily Protein [Plasmodium ovale wallikeri]SBT73601.1 Plasmodium vivax Vir protein, putative [Plasmodium ovale]